MRSFLVRWFAAVLLSTVLALMISWMCSRTLFPDNPPTKPVFKEEKVHRLTNENLVDYLVSRQIKLTIQRADLRQQNVYLELTAFRQTKPEMEHEMVRLICPMLEQVENINRVEVLVHFRPGESYFVEAGKEDLPALQKAPMKALSDQEILEGVFEMTRFSSRSRDEGKTLEECLSTKKVWYTIRSV
ncbi:MULTISPECIES: hypothetical protein [Thermoactinomyces]|uniref:Uncharacterized protein n=2 Tax=Thermoactinomyces TaxID=2023 RepID=A0A8I1AG40_THEIN|nr:MULTISPECIES: hypothetical protein [Thermoactinomyces]KFZ40535.1 hypothetical protein JS81_06975 [Thermoactinomyces sp. Gus2-1]KYQ87841.1 hypothetical protein AYX07_03970 [Thermoactinomyces sp. AS95]MBA4548961.1 hypothetical protein [Thermoactinomyces intermedius]MBA4550421.1 hypothetical protein [Thermoactinomyces vulgaris]MBA4595832.1 hypothetical protein [Thermoactinomyces vulgaris]